ncbi:putative pumilio homolog 7, chloroplastic [Setaria viridis]|uniref:putative pumilio homolog 7, chloroplastic n=1 Tax=Setaria viridis TaxID=4556 RepID=UPI003B3B2029
MVKCFKAATNPELQDFEKIILSHTVQIAKGEFSNYFLQKVLQHGGERLRLNITDCVVEHLVSLSLDRYGTHVVQACFPRTASGGLPLLVRLRLRPALEKFRRLSDEQLAQLVQDCYANYVVRELLLAGKGVSSQLPSCHVGAGAGAGPSSIDPQLPAVFIRVEYGVQGSPEETVALARRIKKLPVAGWEHIDQAVRRVMVVVRMVLP